MESYGENHMQANPIAAQSVIWGKITRPKESCLTYMAQKITKQDVIKLYLHNKIIILSHDISHAVKTSAWQKECMSYSHVYYALTIK